MSDLGTFSDTPSHLMTARSCPSPTTNLSFVPLTGSIKDTNGASIKKFDVISSIKSKNFEIMSD